ncbi:MULTISPECIES: hypothetical protein [unclassified Erwinia]|uniref:hypothetical protein n=1 Tax=unclassified Erwinia TaxID=2622719 RepID=UPI0013044501|nr:MULTISPECIES: hypothetical protein [unclassified Erwinia]
MAVDARKMGASVNPVRIDFSITIPFVFGQKKFRALLCTFLLQGEYKSYGSLL